LTHYVFPQSFRRIFNEGKKSFWKNTLQVFPGVREMGDPRESLLTVKNYNRPVKDLVRKDLLTNEISKLGVSRQLTLSVFIETKVSV
jgi:hypothetical protein